MSPFDPEHREDHSRGGALAGGPQLGGGGAVDGDVPHRGHERACHRVAPHLVPRQEARVAAGRSGGEPHQEEVQEADVVGHEDRWPGARDVVVVVEADPEVDRAHRRTPERDRRPVGQLHATRFAPGSRADGSARCRVRS